MNRIEYLGKLAEVLDYDGQIASNQEIESIPEWDSLGVLSVIELLADLGVKVHPEVLQKMQNISEILEVVGSKIHE